MKRVKIFFNPIDGSAPLSATFSDALKGDAVEAKNGTGVGFFSPEGELLAVTFDDVQETNGHQFLLFSNYRIDIWIRDGKVKIEVTRGKNPKRARTHKAA